MIRTDSMPTVSGADFDALPIAPGLEPMEAKLARALPQGESWTYEPKWDGFRCLAFRQGAAVLLQAKSGKPLTRYFPEVVERLRCLKPDRFVLDGELLVASDKGFAFDALQMRLHPAESRIRRLSVATPATLMLFDLLAAPGGRDISGEPLADRRAALTSFVATASEAALQLSPHTEDLAQAQAWLAEGGPSVDGVMAKRLDGAYAAGERAMLKVKRIRTADCIVGGFRYGEGTKLVGSLLLGLYRDGLLHHVGFTSSLSAAERPALTERLEAMIEPPGFTGKAPGGPSRWATARSAQWRPLRPELVVEVAFDQVTGERFRHGTRLLRWRPDKAARQCGFEQLAT
ncbi:ATP-dependent DNA ligase [Caulobacter sp. S45]|uniref:ATP-dependent DNA ligase n=1 Tax=Caulobacter sp. S45 TaxID=1641861 RepID=UPI0020B11B5B|nr:ATP-dependent DNA ligase [Caulobacter sp. S45]